MKASERYRLVEGSSGSAIEIASGPFTGTVYSYGKVSFKDKHIGVPVLQFQYTVISSPLPKKLLETQDEFKNLLGDILHDLLEYQYLIHDGPSDTSVDNSSQHS